MSKQTAVEWLKKELEEYGSSSHLSLDWETFDELVEQAKAMEREQIVSFCYDFIPTIQVVDNETVYTQLPEEIYNKTYGKEASHEA